jgi:hypothetical protein
VNAEEQRYTIEEAVREIALRDCVLHGHDYEIITRMGENRPHLVYCSRCGESWLVSR